MTNRQIEIPVNNNENVISRSLSENHPENQNLFSSNKEFLDLLREVKIRFDTNPKGYQREDYQKLIELIAKVIGAQVVVDIDIVDQWYKVIDQNTLPGGLLIKETLESIEQQLGNIYSEGTGITFKSEEDETISINANTNATTTREIIISSGAPINALGIFEGNVIPEGKSIQEILEALLNREIFPSAAEKPDFTISGTSFGVREMGDTVTITDPTTNKSNGQFKASFSIPSQPTVQGVNWSNETSSSEIISGFSNGNIITLGENKITYTFNKTYSSPSNKPITNLNHPTESTSKISVDGSDLSATWREETIIKTYDITAIGVYPVFTNISGNTLTDNVNNKCALTDSNIVIIEDIPSEVVNNKHFKFAFPANRNLTFEIRDPFDKTKFVPFDSTYTITEVTNFTHNTTYKVLETTGDKQGIGTYKFILTKSLSE